MLSPIAEPLYCTATVNQSIEHGNKVLSDLTRVEWWSLLSAKARTDHGISLYVMAWAHYCTEHLPVRMRSALRPNAIDSTIL